MSAREWFEGDLAIVTTKSGREYRAVYTLAPGIDYFWRQIDNERLRGKLTDPDVDARPLVTIDPENREQVERLLGRFYGLQKVAAVEINDFQAALREFANGAEDEPEPEALPDGLVLSSDRSVLSWRGENYVRQNASPPTPPKPDEPTGLGAVVEDEAGNQWVAISVPSISTGAWVLVGTVGPARLWRSINAVRVLSEGVQS